MAEEKSGETTPGALPGGSRQQGNTARELPPRELDDTSHLSDAQAARKSPNPDDRRRPCPPGVRSS